MTEPSPHAGQTSTDIESNTDTAVINRAMERAYADLPPEGTTIEAGPIGQMREELFAVLFDSNADADSGSDLDLGGARHEQRT